MSDVKRVLLLSLSTFPYDSESKRYSIQESEFRYRGEDGVESKVVGKYQLDPIPNLLVKLGIELDYVILLATSAVKKVVSVYDVDNKMEINTSASDYYIKFLKDKMSKDADIESAIKVIDINENNPADAIDQASKLINDFEKSSKLHIYIDTHGGFRSTQMVVEAILGLLINDKVEKTVYSIYNEEGNRRIKIDGAEQIFDFVSGINEFRNYGRIDSLLNYLDFEENKAILGPICAISEGIQWCNIVKFEQGLKELKKYYEDEKPIEDRYLALFSNQIREDYGALLTGTEIGALDMVKWCLRKGFYQQSLTIIESRVASLLINRGIMSITSPVGVDFCNRYITTIGDSRLSDNDLFNGCVHKFMGGKGWLLPSQFNTIFAKDKSEKEIKDSLEALIHKKISKMNSMNIQKLLWSAQNTSVAKAFDKENGNSIVYNVKGVKVVEYKGDANTLVMFLLLHKVMKDIRNKANHAADQNSYAYEATKKAIEFHVLLVEELSEGVKNE